MPADLTSEQVWRELGGQLFAVLAYVTPRGEPRSVGVVYVVEDGRLHVATQTGSWKARHLRANPAVSVTVPIAKRIPFLPWIAIPAATINLHGVADVREARDVEPTLLRRLLRGGADDAGLVADTAVIGIEPRGDFTTYGVGVSLREMRDRDQARGRVPVG